MAAFPLPPFLSPIRTPGWRRSLLLRRLLAGVLVVAAVLTALRDVGTGTPRALVFARPVPAGDTLSRDDVTLVPVPDHLRPATAVIEPGEVEGRVVAVDTAAGDVVTGVKFIGTDLSEALVGEITTIVPVRPAEPEILPLLRHGDSVTILTATPEQTESDVIATGGRVVLVDTRESPGTLLVGLPETEATAVAAASLTVPLAVVLTSDLPH